MSTSRLVGSWPIAATVALAALLWIGCGGADEVAEPVVPAPTVEVDQPPTAAPVGAADALPPTGRPELLSEWAQVVARDGELVLGEGVTPYTLGSALFSDHALKLRTVWLPAGAGPAGYDAEDAFDFPVGTTITKTFYYPVAAADAFDSGRVLKVSTGADPLAEPLDLDEVRLLETRVLVHREDGWHALPYVWNDEQTEATLARTGDLIALTLVDGATETPFPYVVPNVNQCAGCHATNHTTGAIMPIGLKARHLDTRVDLGSGPVGQLAAWRDRGLLAELPVDEELPGAVAWDDETASLGERARAYLDINCSHCHNRVGPADTSGLFLEASTEVGPSLGVCKLPIAAGTGTGGRAVGIHPGQPDDSIFVYRLETTDPGAMMPELGRSLTHDEGVELVSAWIASLDGGC